MVFVGCTGAICLALLMIQIQLTQVFDIIYLKVCATEFLCSLINPLQSNNGIDSSVLLSSIFGGIWGTFFVFATCESSERFDSALSEVDDTIGQLDWYLLPFEVQRMLPLIMAYTQKALTIKFFGSIACSRELFKKICYKIEYLSTHQLYIR